MKAEGASPHSLLGVLVWAGAPEPVLGWLGKEPLAARPLAELDDEVNELFERAPSASALVWPLAASGFPLDRLATGLALLLEERASELGEQVLLDALEIGLGTIEDPSLGQSALVHAKKCELVAERGAPQTTGGYRDAADRRLAICRAVAHFDRAAEAIGGYGARASIERQERSRHAASMLGIGSIAGAPVGLVAHQRVVAPSLARPLATHLPPPPELVVAAEQLGLSFGELERLEKPTKLRDALLSELED